MFVDFHLKFISQKQHCLLSAQNSLRLSRTEAGTSCLAGQCYAINVSTCELLDVSLRSDFHNVSLRTDYHRDQDGCFYMEEMKATVMYHYYLNVPNISPCNDLRK